MKPIAVAQRFDCDDINTPWAVVVAGWELGDLMTKESAEHCARDINQAHADGIKEAVKVALAHQEMELFSEKRIAERIEKAVAEAVRNAETCRECGGTDSVCLKGHEDSMKEVRERERKAVAERDARIAELEKALRLSVKELVAWSEKINPFGWHFCCDSNVDGPENHNAECGVYSAIQISVAVLGKGER